MGRLRRRASLRSEGARSARGLLPEKIESTIAVPAWPEFLRGCLRYRESLERELPNAPVADEKPEED